MNHARTAPRRREWIVLVLILLLAAALRMGAPGITEFKRDEANLSRLALDVAQGRDLPLLGISSSVNLPNPPINVYLFALPYALDRSPIAATLFVGMLNVLAVALTWWLARRYYGAFPALIAASLYAVAPWGVVYARKIWAQDVLAPFVLLTVLTGLLGYTERKRWAQIVHWPLLALTVQIHIGAFTLIPLSILMLLRWRTTINWRALGAGVALAALTGLPVLAGYARADLLDLAAIRERMTSSESDPASAVSSTALEHAWRTVAGTDIHSLAGPEQFRAYLDRVPDELAYPLFHLLPAVALLSAGWLAWRALRRHASTRTPDLVLAAWLALPVLAFSYEWTDVTPHYMIPLMPAAYILCGVGITDALAALDRMRIPGPARRGATAGVGVLLAAIAVLHVWLWVDLLRFMDKHTTPGGFGTPLHYLLDVRDAVLKRDPADVLVISTQEQAPFDEHPAVWDVLLAPVPSVRFVDSTRTAVIPAGTTLEVIAWSPALRTCDAACREANRTFEQRPGEPPYVLRPAPEQSDITFTAIDPQHFANGAHVTGYTRSEDHVILRWTLDGPVDADYQVFVHALDASGERFAQADRPAWPGAYWRAGDTLLLWFDLTLPPETTALYTGMYTTDGVRFDNVPLVDANGAYLDQGATIPLVTD